MIKHICILILSTLLLSCTADAPKVRLNKEERKYIDSLFSARVPEIDTLMDSLCVVRRENDYQRLKDSLIDIRMKEIEAIRKK